MGTERSRWRLLGEVGVDVDGVAVPFRGQRHRAVIAYLLLNSSTVVTVDRLVDAIWGDRPPNTARNSIQRFVADIRRSLGDLADHLVTAPGGYRLIVDPDAIDLTIAERAVDRARRHAADGDLQLASIAWREVFEEWSGRSLSGVGDVEFVESARVRLAEIRASAIEQYVECQLELGRHAEVGATIEDFAEQHPTRDRAWKLLMLARYRNGRQVEALDAYTRFRQHLVEQLGLEPSPDVEDLRVSILEHSVNAVDVAAPQTEMTGGSASPPSRSLVSGGDGRVEVHQVLPLPVHLAVDDAAPFSGRSGELAIINAALRTGAGRARMFFIAGEPGMGKSRSAGEIAAVAHSRGSNVLYGRCTSGAVSDFQPWRGVVP